MATAQIQGSARFEWTPPGDSLRTLLLAVPLSPMREIVPSRKRSRFDWWAEDEVNREVVTVGDGVREVVASIWFENEPIELMDMLQAALESDITLTYYRTSDGPGFPVRVVEIIGADHDEIVVQPDRRRWGGGEWEVAVRFRRTDGGTLDGVFTG